MTWREALDYADGMIEHGEGTKAFVSPTLLEVAYDFSDTPEQFIDEATALGMAASMRTMRESGLPTIPERETIRIPYDWQASRMASERRIRRLRIFGAAAGVLAGSLCFSNIDNGDMWGSVLWGAVAGSSFALVATKDD